MSVISSIASDFGLIQPASTAEVLAALHRHEGHIVIEKNCRQIVDHLKPAEISDERVARHLDEPELFMPVNGLRRARRNGQNVGWLNSVFADIDIYHDAAPDPWHIEFEINRLVRLLIEQRRLMMPSVIVRSGRGFWVHLLLREQASHLSVATTLAAYEQWVRVAKSFNDWLKNHGFPVDHTTGVDRARLTRFPNSINQNVGRRVIYTVNVGVLYTLDELEAAFPTATVISNAEPAPSAYAEYIEYKPATVQVPERRNGWDALREQRKRDLRALLGQRGQERRDDRVKAGGRHDFAVILALAAAGDIDRVGLVERFGKNACDPPMTDAEIRRSLAVRFRKTRDTTIGRRLNITPAENERLEGDYLTPRPVREPCKNQGRTRAARREKIASYLAVNGDGHSARKIAKALGLARKTVARDLKVVLS